ncbi:MAG: bifunctional oligoribonuclease/PAP phosphatase NrnA, partial [Chthoniobacterales bacterium]|nr:bifunctional oligoribonuclease/PAP phosphatase NrnA [Chthoniobacterales bacterium]
MNGTAASGTAPAARTTQSSLAEIAAALRAHQRFVIISHVRPDGDALGSELALGLSLL